MSGLMMMNFNIVDLGGWGAVVSGRLNVWKCL